MSGIVYKQIGTDGNAVAPGQVARAATALTSGLSRVVGRPSELLSRLPVRQARLSWRIFHRFSHVGDGESSWGEAIKGRARTTPRLLSLNNSVGVVRESFAGFVARPRSLARCWQKRRPPVFSVRKKTREMRLFLNFLKSLNLHQFQMIPNNCIIKMTI